MYGELLYGGTYGTTTAPIGIVSEDISFNGYGLQNSSIIVEYFNPLDFGDVEYNTFNIPQDNGKGFLSKFWREKTLIIKGIIKTDSQTALESKIDEIKKYIRQNQGVLKYKLGDGTYRQIKATCTNTNFDKQFYNISWIPFELEFKNNEPFWYNTSSAQKLFESVSYSPFLEEITNTGNEESKPQIFFSFISATSVTSVTVSLNNRSIIWTGTISSGDFLMVDCLNKIIQKNSINQDYNGTFPNLIPGVNPITFTIDGTFSVDIATIHRLNFN